MSILNGNGTLHDAKEWLPNEHIIASKANPEYAATVGELRMIYRHRMKREPAFASEDQETAALHALLMMDKAHSADHDD